MCEQGGESVYAKVKTRERDNHLQMKSNKGFNFGANNGAAQ
jgi:hypothetical protein